MSLFGGMNLSAAAAPPPAAASTSSFSFIKSSSAPPPEVESAPPVPAGPSAFSFISGGSSASSAPEAAPKPAASAFSFIGGGASSVATAAEPTEPIVERIAEPMVLQSNSGVKKKKNAKVVRPGHARYEADSHLPESPKSEPRFMHNRDESPTRSHSPSSLSSHSHTDTALRENGHQHNSHSSAAALDEPPFEARIQDDRQQQHQQHQQASAGAAGLKPSLPASTSSSSLSLQSLQSAQSHQALSQQPTKDQQAKDKDPEEKTPNAFKRLFGWGSKKSPEEKSPVKKQSEPEPKAAPSTPSSGVNAFRQSYTPNNQSPQLQKGKPASAESAQHGGGSSPSSSPRNQRHALPQLSQSSQQAQPTQQQQQQQHISSGSAPTRPPLPSSSAREEPTTASTTQQAGNTAIPASATTTEKPSPATVASRSAAPSQTQGEHARLHPARRKPGSASSAVGAASLSEKTDTQSRAEAKKETVIQQSIRVMEEAKDSVRALDGRRQALQDEQATIFAEQRQRSQTIVLKRKRVLELEKLLEQAVAEDNYDSAATLGSDMESLKAELDTSDVFSCVTASPDRIKSILEGLRQIAEEEFKTRQNAVQILESSLQQQLEELNSFRAELEDTTRSERSRIKTERSRLERARGHLKLDKEHLQQTEERWESLARERTSEFHKTKKSLEDERDEVRLKIEETERLLRELKSQEEHLSRAISKEEDRIEAAEQELFVEKKEVDAERASVQTQEAKLRVQEEELDLAQKQLNESTSEARGEVERLDEAISSAREHIGQAREAMTSITVVKQQLTRFIDSRPDDSPVIESIRSIVGTDEVSSKRQAAGELDRKVQDLSSVVLELQSSSSALKKKLADIADRKPELENAKKVAVTGRNFKEAGRITEELKQLLASEEEYRAQREEAETSLRSMTEELESTKSSLSVLQSELSGLELHGDRRVIDALASVRADLGRNLRRARRHALPTASITEADLHLAEDITEQLCVKHGIQAPAVPLEDETDEEEEGATGVTTANLISLDMNEEDLGAMDLMPGDSVASNIANDLLNLDLAAGPSSSEDADAAAGYLDVEADTEGAEEGEAHHEHPEHEHAEHETTDEKVLSLHDGSDIEVRSTPPVSESAAAAHEQPDEAVEGDENAQDAAATTETTSAGDADDASEEEKKKKEQEEEQEREAALEAAREAEREREEAERARAEALEAAKVRLAQLEGELNDALLQEDYDLCESLNDQIQAVRSEHGIAGESGTEEEDTNYMDQLLEAEA